MKLLLNYCSRIPLWIWCALVFCVAVAARFYWIDQKEDFHCDESMSISLCNYGAGIAPEFEADTMSGRELKNFFFANEAGVKDFVKDIYNLRKDNRDYPHTNFYYSCLRAALYGCDSTDMPSVVRRGFFLNLAFFSVGFVFLALLLKELFREKLQIVTGLAMGTLCTGMLSMSVFLRPYELWFATTMIFAYAFAVGAKRYFTDAGTLVSFKNLWIYAVVTAGAMLSVYFSIVLVVLLGAILCGLAIKKNGAKTELPFFTSVFALAVILATAIYPNYPFGFLSERGADVSGKFSIAQIFENLHSAYSGIMGIPLNEAFGLPVVTLLIVGGIAILVLRKTRKNREFADDGVFENSLQGKSDRASGNSFIFWSLFAAATVAFVAIIYLVPWKVVRYVAALLPILLLIVPRVFSFARLRWIGVCGNILAIALFAVGAFTAEHAPFAGRGIGPLDSAPQSLSERIFRSVSRRIQNSFSQKIENLVYSRNLANEFSSVRLFETSKNFAFVMNSRVHGFPLMEMPDNAQVYLVKQLNPFDPVCTIPDTLPQGEKTIIVISAWSFKNVPSEIRLPHGKLGKEMFLDCIAVAYEFVKDPAAPESTLRLNLERGKSGGNFYDVITNTPATE